MKILFYRYGSLCEPDILDCFNESGHTVNEITIEITNKSTTYGDTLSIVGKALQDSPCDCVFSVNYYPALSDICNVYHIRYICWVVDSPVLELFDKSIINPYNRVFIFDRELYKDIYPLNPSCVFHFPLAVNISGKQSAIHLAHENGEYNKYISDISFVGSLYAEKDPLHDFDKLPNHLRGFLQGAIDSQLKVYGYYFVDSVLNDEIIDEFKSCINGYDSICNMEYLSDKQLISQEFIGNHITAIERTQIINTLSANHNVDVYTASDASLVPHARCKGTCSTENEMPVIFNASRINLNPTCRSIRSGVPLRCFDIMACEGFMLSNYQTELCELFVPGEDFAFYDSLEAIPDIVAYYLEHEAERREIAHNGYIKVRDNYNYMIRLNSLLLQAFES